MSPEGEVYLTVEVDGEGVVRVISGSESLTLTPYDLGRVLTAIISAITAQDGDDRQEVHLGP